MPDEKKVSIPKKDRAVVEKIIAANDANTNYFLKSSIATRLYEAGILEVHPSMVDDKGNKAVRVTAAGREAMAKPPVERTPIAAPPGGFAILDNIELPAAKPRGPRGTTYPFLDLKMGQSFFVPNDPNKADDNVARRLNSTVNSANKRGAASGLHFRIAEYEHAGVKGAIIKRVPPPAPATPAPAA